VAGGFFAPSCSAAKHFELTITDDALSFARNQDNIKAEAAVDGLYIIRTSLKAERMDAAACVRTYKSLAQVERAFLSMKMWTWGRTIHHYLEGRVRAHIFLCMLAYYVDCPAGDHSTRQWLTRSAMVLPPSSERRIKEFSPVMTTSPGSASLGSLIVVPCRLFVESSDTNQSVRVTRQLPIEHAHHRLEVQTFALAARMPLVRRR